MVGPGKWVAGDFLPIGRGFLRGRFATPAIDRLRYVIVPHSLHGETPDAVFTAIDDRRLKAGFVREARISGQFAPGDVRQPVGAAPGIADGEAGFPGERMLRCKQRWHRNRLAPGHQGGTLCGRDPDACAAVAPRPAAAEDGVQPGMTLLREDFRKRLEQQCIVSAVADEPFFRNDSSIRRECQGRRVGGGFNDQHGTHAVRLGGDPGFRNPKLAQWNPITHWTALTTNPRKPSCNLQDG